MPKGKSARQFAIDLKKFGKVTRQQAEVIFRKITLELDTAIVFSTPVATGRARGNWYPSLSAPSSDVDESATDPSGSDSVRRVESTALSAKLGQTVWMTNNLPYILPLENGHSKQAPQGMVDINLERVAAHYGGRIER